jgi:murein DD-endopeptidase MepM/ murein hydrolase activator NlpD
MQRRRWRPRPSLADRRADRHSMTMHPAVLSALGAVIALTLGTCVGSVSAQSNPARGAAGAPARPPVRPPARTLTPPPIMVPALTLASATISQGDLVRGTITPTNGQLTMNGVPVRVAVNGHFIIGFDRDATGSATLRLTARGITPIERTIPIAPRTWNIQNINAPARGGASSDADFNRRRPGELAQMAAARRTVVVSDGWRQNFIWPVTGRISGVFGSQRVYRGEPGSFHNGVDVAAPAGTPYVAPADGVVILAASQPFTLEGNLLMIDHGMGVTSVFLHSQRLEVRTGDVVRQGQRLGTVGATGRATGPHMHWAMRWNDRKIDAQRFAGPMPR